MFKWAKQEKRSDAPVLSATAIHVPATLQARFALLTACNPMLGARIREQRSRWLVCTCGPRPSRATALDYARGHGDAQARGGISIRHLGTNAAKWRQDRDLWGEQRPGTDPDGAHPSDRGHPPVPGSQSCPC